MRKIAFFAGIISSALIAATPEMSFKNELQSAQGSFNPDTAVASTSQWNQTLSVQSISLRPYTLDAALARKDHDYTNLQLFNERKESHALPRETEWVGSLAPTFEMGENRVAATWQGTLGRANYAQQSFGLEVGHSFYNRSTRLEADAKYSDQHRPADFYEVDFRPRLRPQKVQSVEYGLAAEQVWSEITKSRMRISTREKRWERPRSVGVEISQAVALSDHWFSQAHLGRYQELRSQPLLNERGYFDAWTAKAELGFEPAFDWLISASYGLGVEYEFDSRISKDVRVGSDQYALSISYQARALRVGLQSSYLKTNTGAKLVGAIAELGWAL